jgi:hypothetical protein
LPLWPETRRYTRPTSRRLRLQVEERVTMQPTKKPRAKRWRDFEEAKEFARSSGLKTALEWFAFAKSGDRPSDIPAYPNEVYKSSGWAGWGDWLGTGNVRSGDWRPFEEARELVHTLDLGNRGEWREYIKSGRKPGDIPADPERVYGNKWKRR